MIRVLVVDDHVVVRQGLSALFSNHGLMVVGEAHDSEGALEACDRLAPDVVLLDVRLSDGDGLDVLARLRAAQNRVRVVMFSAHDNPTYVARAVALGANDFVMKSAPTEMVVDAIQRSVRGDAPSPQSVLSTIRELMQRRRELRRDDTSLTNRELQVVRHMALGLSNREIGLSLNISVETVKEHVQNVLRKTAATDRTQAAVWAVRRGLV